MWMLSEDASLNRKTVTFVPGRMTKQEIMYKDWQRVSDSCEEDKSYCIITHFYCTILYILPQWAQTIKSFTDKRIIYNGYNMQYYIHLWCTPLFITTMDLK